MKFSTLTFNLEYHRGFAKLLKAIDRYQPDIISAQEFDISDESIDVIQARGYKLSDSAPSFNKFGRTFGVVTFHKKSTIKLSSSHTINLHRGVYEIFWFFIKRSKRRTVVATTFDINKTAVTVCNVHFSPIAVNSLRNKQLRKTLKTAASFKPATIVQGDFNYPYQRKKLERLFKEFNFREATNDIFHTFFKKIQFLPIRFKLDYVLYRDLEHVKTIRIDTLSTDHTPIYAEFIV